MERSARVMVSFRVALERSSRAAISVAWEARQSLKEGVRRSSRIAVADGVSL